jgi:hypothetical protein
LISLVESEPLPSASTPVSMALPPSGQFVPGGSSTTLTSVVVPLVPPVPFWPLVPFLMVADVPSGQVSVSVSPEVEEVQLFALPPEQAAASESGARSANERRGKDRAR